MSSSGTYAFAPEIADVVDDAFERCGIDPAALSGRHLRSARRSLDFMFAEWANRSVRLWAVDVQTQTLTAGSATYTAATGTQAILESFVRRDGIDTPVTPMARDEYALIPDKTTEGLPSSYWLDRATGIYTLWQVPENSTDVLHYYRLRQVQDSGGISYTPDVPYLWTNALCSGLAARLAEKWAPEREPALVSKASNAFAIAYQEDRERTPTRIRARLRR